MTLEALQNAIANLLVARREAHGNEAEQARINAKLDKLYNLKYTLLEQESQKKWTLNLKNSSTQPYIRTAKQRGCSNPCLFWVSEQKRR